MIVNKLRQAGVTGAPAAADLPWFDKHPNPVFFSLAERTGNLQASVQDLVALGNDVSTCCPVAWPTLPVWSSSQCSRALAAYCVAMLLCMCTSMSPTLVRTAQL